MSGAGDLVDAAIAFVPHLFRQTALATYGVVLLTLVPAGLLWSRLDHRTVNDESAATKPTKFLLSIGMHALTLSWMFGFVRPDRAHAILPMLAVWVVLVSSTWELGCIGWQAARARESHFNHETTMDSAIFMSMGVFATLLVVGNLPLAWEIARRPSEGADPVMMYAVIAGLLVSCFVGGGTGILMGARNSHGVGREGRRLPLLGWSAVAGDIRASHFLSIHALQALPLLAGVVGIVAGDDAALLFAGAALAYCVLTAATLVQAFRGHPIITLKATEPASFRAPP